MKRFVNAAVAFAVTFVAYQAYVLGVAPLIEPQIAFKEYDAAEEADWRGGKRAVVRYQEMLRSYLPAGHWALSGSPKVVEYAPASVVAVIDDFEPMDRGRLKLTKCLLVAFPTPRPIDGPPPRDAIVIEAPDNTTIQFDDLNADFDLASGKLGRPVAAELPGEFVIRSDMKEAGPHDDLYLVTSDLHFNQSMIWTRSAVDLRLGPHRAHGRVLEIRLLKEPHTGAGSSGLPIAGVESLEIREQVRATIDVRQFKKSDPASERVVLTPQGPVRLASAEAPLAASEPLEVTSAGPFRFDFTGFVASLQDDVRAALPNAAGPSDQLHCRELRLHFGDQRGDSAALNPAHEPDLARRQGRTLGGLTPRRVEAVGSPVRLDSPTRQAAVRATRLEAWLGERRLRIEGAPASLAQGLSELQAPLLEYDAPPEDSNQAIGDLLVAGPGWVRFAPDADRQGRAYQARWSALPDGQPAVTMRRDPRGQPLLTILGRPEFAASGLGKMRADRVTMQLREVQPDGPDGPAFEISTGGKPGQLAVLAKRIDATGRVDFVGKQFKGHSDTLATLLLPIAAPTESGGRGLGSTVAFQSAGAEAQPSLYELNTRNIQIEVGLHGRQATPLALVCDGGVKIDELTSDPAKQPLKILGDQLRVDRLDRPGGARLTLAGRQNADPSGTGDLRGLAEIQSQGLRVWVKDLHIDQGAGRAWTEGRGDARLTLRAAGPAAPLGGEATLRWRGGMQFDGSLMTLSDEVYAEASNGWLHCAALTAKLSDPIDLRGGGSGLSGSAVDVEEVECVGGVTIDYRTTDEVGQRSHEHAQLASLAYNQRTGAIAGQGPGSIRSTRLASGGLLDQGQKKDADKAGLRFLRVDFRNALGGNANERAIRFLGGVQAVYGPVLAWEQQLPLQSPQGVPPEAAELRCDELRVHESPAASVARGAQQGAPFGPIELRAIGSVRIDASVGEAGGGVVAEAASASYSQAGDRVVLEGSGSQLARLWARPDGSQPYAPATARRITHYLSQGRTSIDDLRGVEYQPGPNASRPLPPRR